MTGVKEDRSALLEKAARLYYVDELPQKDIARELNYKEPSSVARLIKEARDRGVIAFDIDASFAIFGRVDPTLSRRLRDAFNLTNAIVVQTDELSREGSERGDSLYACDDKLHTALANQAGMAIRDRIQPGAHLAVGSGRSVYQCSRMIKRRPPSRRDIRITPLSGRIWTHRWHAAGRPSIYRPLDADDAARLLAIAFENEPGTRFSQVTYPIFAQDKEEAESIMREHCPFWPDGTWPVGEPDIALVGIGAVDPKSGHRIADLFREQTEPVDPYLKKEADNLKGLVRFVEEQHISYFGDLTNRFFPALPLPRKLNPESLDDFTQRYRRLSEELSRLNERMIVANWSHIFKIKFVIAIAGGPFKIDALWTLLITRYLKEKRIIDELVTDAESALKLIDALDQYHQYEAQERKDGVGAAGKGAICRWYKQQVDTLFPAAPE